MTKVRWMEPFVVPPTVDSCYKQMAEMGTTYGHLLEAKLHHWEERSAELRSLNPKCRDGIEPSVAAVLPEKYHPDVHRELLRSSGASDSVVDHIHDPKRFQDEWSQPLHVVL